MNKTTTHATFTIGQRTGYLIDSESSYRFIVEDRTDTTVLLRDITSVEPFLYTLDIENLPSGEEFVLVVGRSSGRDEVVRSGRKF